MKSRIPYPRLTDQFHIDAFDRLKTDLSDVIDDANVSYDTVADRLSAPQSITADDWGDGDMLKAAAHHLLRNFLRKYSVGYLDPALKKAALEKFLTTESVCRGLNQQAGTQYTDTEDRKILPERVYRRARAFIRSVLGDSLPSFDVLTRTSRFGPGSTVDVSWRLRNRYYKYLRWPYACPVLAVDLAYECLRSDERWWGALEDSVRRESDSPMWALLDHDQLKRAFLRPVGANVVTFVPKTTSSARTIAKETRLGVYLQLGVDGYIRSRLKHFGIDIDDQSRNRSFAISGSRDDNIATLDLSSASDSISLSICEELLPPAWFEYLCMIRSQSGILPDGSCITYEKISSMGNGYTFALETLIFAAITFAVVARSRWSLVSVYGDDIVCPVTDCDHLCSALDAAGFRVNDKKSFFSGPFRESCGCDAWHGIDITPVYLKRPPRTVADLYGLYNRLHAWYRRFHPTVSIGQTDFCDCEVARFILDRIPTGHIVRGPALAEYPDQWIHNYSFRPNGQTAKVRGVFRTVDATPPSELLFGRLMDSLSDLPVVDPWSDELVPDGTCFTIPGKTRVVYRTVDVFITPTF